MSGVDLRVDWCSYEAAKYAVEHWHYSRRMPKSKLNMIGVWENDEFTGVVIFGVGATRALVNPYGLEPDEGCELVRIALTDHVSPVSKIGVSAIRLLRLKNPELRIIVSFADPGEGHNGAIYQAMNWVYTGRSEGCYFFRDKAGKLWHPRNVSEDLWRAGKVIKPSQCAKVWRDGKHRYLYPLDRAMRRQIEPLRKPYPKRVPSVHGDTVGDQPTEAGSSPAARSELIGEG